jgi:aquaporin Z
MSMNPARTVASALAAHHWMAVWVYFVAPLTGMLLAAETFVRSRSRVRIPCGKIMHAEPCLFCEHVAGRQMARASVAMSHRTERLRPRVPSEERLEPVEELRVLGAERVEVPVFPGE